MNARKQAIRSKLEREPKMSGRGRPAYGGAVLTRAGAERQFGRFLNQVAFGRKGRGFPRNVGGAQGHKGR